MNLKIPFPPNDSEALTVKWTVNLTLSLQGRAFQGRAQFPLKRAQGVRRALPRRYEDFARETAEKWKKDLPWPINKVAEKLNLEPAPV